NIPPERFDTLFAAGPNPLSITEELPRRNGDSLVRLQLAGRRDPDFPAPREVLLERILATVTEESRRDPTQRRADFQSVLPLNSSWETDTFLQEVSGNHSPVLLAALVLAGGGALNFYQGTPAPDRDESRYRLPARSQLDW